MLQILQLKSKNWKNEEKQNLVALITVADPIKLFFINFLIFVVKPRIFILISMIFFWLESGELN